MSANYLAASVGSPPQGRLGRRKSTRPSNLATQHCELVAKHDDLQLLELDRAEAQDGQL
jgi:hypothetical protein